MNRRILALGAVIVLVALGGLLFALRGHDAPSVAPPHEEAARGTTHRDEARPSFAESGAGTAARAEAPAPPSRGDTLEVPAGGSATKEYVVGDVRVRDHRTGDHPIPDLPPAVHPPQGRRLPSTLTNELAQQLRKAVASCAASVPAEARGPAPKIDGEIIIAIKDHQASITSATFQPRDVTGDANDAVKQCLASRAIGLATPSGEQADLDHYAVTLSLVLP
jgi:hypothetical protein